MEMMTDVHYKKIEEFRKLQVVSATPILARIDDLWEDAARQYDELLKKVLLDLRGKLVADLEAAATHRRWIPVAHASQIVDRPESTIRYWCRKEKVVARKLAGGDWEIDRESLYARVGRTN